MRIVTLCVHSEKLFDGHVWKSLGPFLAALRLRKAHASFFVMAPYHARCRPPNEDAWLSRLRALVEDGHEIGLHTHFYKDDLGKEISSAGERISCLIHRDGSYFRGKGFETNGFSAGGWVLNSHTVHALLACGFSHDCTGQAVRIGRAGAENRFLDTEKPFRVREGDRGLLEVPTTGSVGSVARGILREATIRSVRVRELEYSLIYVHDYDLLRPLVRYALLGLTALFAWKGAGFVSARELRDLLAGENLEELSIEDFRRRFDRAPG